MFEAVILAGGKGTRLKSITGELPKPMVDLNGVPFLFRLMDRLEQHGCRKIVLSLGYKSDYIINIVTDTYHGSCPIEFSVENSPLGTGGGIKLASNKISQDKFIVLNGDTFFDLDYKKFIEFSCDSDISISGVRVDDVNRYGSLELDDKSNLVSMREKGGTGSGVINSGIYFLSKKVFDKIEKDVFSFEDEVLSASEENILVYQANGYFIDIGIPSDYLLACQTIK